MNWLAEVAEHFPRGTKTALPWPVSRFFYCEKERIVYAPIAKCACTSLKSLFIELNDIPHSELIYRHGIHRVADEFITGAKLSDQEFSKVQEALSGDDYYRFAVIREPVSRLISAYTEKFWRNRLKKDNKAREVDILRTVQGQANPDFEKGITFREFVNYIVESEAETLDPHWRPQHYFLVGVSEYNEIFTLEQLDTLQERLSEKTGRTLSLEKLNTSMKAGQTSPPSGSGRLADVHPIDLDEYEGVTSQDFANTDLVDALTAFYSKDCELYEAARTGLRGYRPPQIEVRELPRRIVARDAARDVARPLQLYSKGYFGLDGNGAIRVPIIIANRAVAPINFAGLKSVELKCEVQDAHGKCLLPPVVQGIDLYGLSAQAMHTYFLELQIPLADISRVDRLSVSLVLDQSPVAQEVNPFHFTSLRLLGKP